MFNDVIDNFIVASKPELKNSSIVGYRNSIKKLFKKLYPPVVLQSFTFVILKDYENIIKYINESDETLNTKSHFLSSIKCILPQIPEMTAKVREAYHTAQTDNFYLRKNYDREQKQNPTQSENWVTCAQLKEVVDNYYNEIVEKNILMKTHDSLTRDEVELLQKWVVGCLYTLHPPARLDYNMEVISKKLYSKLSPERKLNNYLVVTGRNKKEFAFGDYKEVKTYGINMVRVLPQLNKVLNMWLAINKTGSLLHNKFKEPLQAAPLGKLISRTFAPLGKHVTLNLIRHVYITENVEQPSIKSKQMLATLMMHSVNMQELYIKKPI